MKRFFVFLSFAFVFIFSKGFAADSVILETLDDTTVLPYQAVGQIGVEGMEQVDETTLIQGPVFDAAFGIGDWAEVGLNYEIISLSDSTEYDDNTASGDVRFRVKAIPIQTDIGNFGFAIITKIPSANNDDGLGTAEADVVLKGIYGTTLFGDLHLFMNLGLAVQGDPRENASQNNYFVWGIGAEYPLSVLGDSPILDGLFVIAEFEGSIGSEENVNIALGEYNDGDAEFRGGFMKELPWFNFSATGSAGLTDDSPSWGFRVMFSKAFDLPIIERE